MTAAVLTQVAPSGSARLLADLQALEEPVRSAREPALTRLEEALGSEFADRLVAALSDDDGPRSRSPRVV
jgi:hypothetical protein